MQILHKCILYNVAVISINSHLFICVCGVYGVFSMALYRNQDRTLGEIGSQVLSLRSDIHCILNIFSVTTIDIRTAFFRNLAF